MDSFSNYMGERDFGDFYTLVTRNRDSDALVESNFRSALKALGGESESVVIHRFGHWACGWWESLSVSKSSPQFAAVEAMAERLEDYPVLDEEDFSQLECEQANQVWKDCYKPSQRVEYVRKHKSQFEFHDFKDLMGCIRGNYFAGYASELLN